MLDGEQSSPGSLAVKGVHSLGEAQELAGVDVFGCTPEFHSVFDPRRQVVLFWDPVQMVVLAGVRDRT